MTELLKKAYDSETFRQQGHELINLLADYLKSVHSEGDKTKVLNWTTPEDLLKKWKEDDAAALEPNPIPFFESILEDTIHMHHPKYVGHQTSNVLPVAALAELLGGFLDPGMGIYEQGTSGVALERLLIKKLAASFGMDPNEADGFFSSGGTLGNLTALLCARQVMIEKDVWEYGLEGKKYAFIASEEAHFSCDRATRVMGLGKDGLIKAPVNEKFQLDISRLEECYQNALEKGIQVIGVIANACSTAVGAQDPIDEIADFCEAKKLWLHVDAAHGGCVVYSEKYKHMLAGIARADSIIMDYHKMLMVPTLVTAVLFKNGDHSYQTFAQKASYLWDNQEGQEWFNLAKRTFELTKTSMSFRIYAILKTYGQQIFDESVTRVYDMAKVFSKMLVSNGNFQLPVAIPDSNIVCFRYFEEELSEEELDSINIAIRQQIKEEGAFYIVQTRIRGKYFLRVTVMNPFTTEKIMEQLIDKIISSKP